MYWHLTTVCYFNPLLGFFLCSLSNKQTEEGSAYVGGGNQSQEIEVAIGEPENA